jgi:hypothetical protein
MLFLNFKYTKFYSLSGIEKIRRVDAVSSSPSSFVRMISDHRRKKGGERINSGICHVQSRKEIDSI